jgi:25S rRNA (uracil2634-N3)-methyltransferase
MSKTKTKRARRELKREGDRKIAAHHRKIAKAAEANKPTTAIKQPAKKKQKTSNTPASTTTSATAPAPVQASQKPRIPFGEFDHILLVGEGDFSFTRSLAIDHGCANVTGTSYDDEEEVCEKYPTFQGIQTELSGLTPPVPLHHGIDATRLSSYKQLRCRRDDDDELDVDGEEERPKGDGWDTIAFMFPHTGGLSTDVNRQVRANQALLVDFFKACLDTSTAKRRLAILEAQKNKVRPKACRVTFQLTLSGRSLYPQNPSSAWAAT